jgi:hypothetical protein
VNAHARPPARRRAAAPPAGLHAHARPPARRRAAAPPAGLHAHAPPTARRRAAALACAVAVLAAGAAPAAARDLWSSEDGTHSVRLQSALKGSWLLSAGPEDPIFNPDPTSAAMLWRLRLEPHAKVFTWLDAGFAYEHASRLSSGAAALGFGGGAGILPSGAAVPWRIWDGDWTLAAAPPAFSHRHEIDRAYLVFRHPLGQITVGRQAIGWGRGLLFGAVDLFAPFSPLEVDREWRRGIDAIRSEVRLRDHLSLDMVVALGHALDTDASAFVARVRGFAGDVDGEAVFGRRGTDWVFGLTSSARVRDAALYGELAFFATRGDGVEGGLFGADGLVAKAVAGASYSFPLGNGLRVFAEYHYNGFGVARASDALSRFLDPAFTARYLRGDLQILGRHALALLGSYDFGDGLWGASLLWLQSPADGSGLFSPSLTWNFAENVTLAASAFLPYGARPENGVLRTEYGGAPFSFFVQVRLYD